MPNRIIREGINSSERVDQLDYPEETFFRRLMSIVDDYGRCSSNPHLIRSNCYPLRTDRVRVTDIARWIAACVKTGLIVLYKAGDGKEYIQIERFRQPVRTKSKHPPPVDGSPPNASEISCFQMKSNDSSRTDTNTNTNTDPEASKLERATNTGKERARAEIATRSAVLTVKLNALFKRPPTDVWGYADLSFLHEVAQREGAEREMAELIEFSGKPGSFFPQSIKRLLESWTEVLDRARVYSPQKAFNGQPATRPMSIMDLKTIIGVKEEKAKKLRDKHYSEGPISGTWDNDSHRLEWKQLRGEISELKERMEKMAS